MTTEKTQATDARDMVKDLKKDINIGCNTDMLTTSEKNVSAHTETNEIGSQAKAQFKEVMCNTNKTNTESQATQKEMIGHEKEVSCLIIKPDVFKKEENIEDNADLPECFRCDGKKVNKKGLPCKKCKGTGYLNNKFFKDLNKILQNEVSKYCTQEYQKLLVSHLAKKKEE